MRKKMLTLVVILIVASIEIYEIKNHRSYRAKRNKESFEFLQEHPIFYLLFTLIGLFSIYVVIKKPKFFMEDKRVSYFYEKLGHKCANCLYLIFGIVSVVFGTVSALQVL